MSSSEFTWEIVMIWVGCMKEHRILAGIILIETDEKLMRFLESLKPTCEAKKDYAKCFDMLGSMSPADVSIAVPIGVIMPKVIPVIRF